MTFSSWTGMQTRILGVKTREPIYTLEENQINSGKRSLLRTNVPVTYMQVTTSNLKQKRNGKFGGNIGSTIIFFTNFYLAAISSTPQNKKREIIYKYIFSRNRVCYFIRLHLSIYKFMFGP